MRAKVYVTPSAACSIRRQGDRTRAARARLRRGARRAGREVHRDARRRRRATSVTGRLDEMCGKLLANGVIEDFRFEIGEEGEGGDALGRGHVSRARTTTATRRTRSSRSSARTAVPLWHKDRVAARRRLRRRCRAASPTATTCAAARWRASRRSWRASCASPRDGGLVLGICNGFQILCEAGLLPGALVRNRGLQLRLRDGRTCGSRRRHAVHRRLPPRRGARRCRSSTARAATSPTRRRSRARGPTARSSSATPTPPAAPREEANPNGSLRNIAGVVNARAQRRRPDAASRARRASGCSAGDDGARALPLGRAPRWREGRPRARRLGAARVL